MRRKLFCVSAAMVFGVWAAGMNGLAAAGLVLAAFFYAGALYVWPEYDMCKLKGLAFACAVAMLVGAVRMALQIYYYDCGASAGRIESANPNTSAGQKDEVNAGASAERKVSVRAEVIKVSQKKDGIPKLTIKIQKSGRKCLLSYYGKGSDPRKLMLFTGSLIEFRGELSEPETAGNPRCFDYRNYLRSQGIGCVSSAGSIKVIKRNGSLAGRIRRMILMFREGFLRCLCRGSESGQSEPLFKGILTGGAGSGQSEPVFKGIFIGGAGSGQSEPLIRGILFGDTDSMDEDMKDDFRRNGTAHVLAVSGLHIGLLYSIFRMLRKKFALPGMTACFLLVLGIYGTMTLWAVSVTRAVTLILIMEVGERLDRPFDLLTSLGFVSMLVLMHEPYALYGTSFEMSYLAALSIGVLCPVVKRIVPDRLPESIKTSLSVQLGLVPFVAFTFNMIPIGALIINIPVVIILTMIVSVSAAAVPVYVAAGFISTVAGIVLPFRWIIDKMSMAMVLINGRFADLGLLSPDVVSPPLFIVAAYYGVLFLICSETFRIASMRKDWKKVTPLAGIVVIMVLISCVLSVSPFDKADIIMVDVGQGDCMHFRFRDHLTIGRGVGSLKDSEKNAEDGGASVRIPMPSRTNVIIDGGGREEYNVGKKVLKPYFLKNGVRRVDLALATHLHTDHYKGIEELKQERMVRQMVTEGRTGDIISIGSSDRIEIIWPDVQDPDTDDENKNSLIFKVYINGITVLITGDLGEEGEHALVQRYKGTDVLDCDVLKVCHHGSKTSNSAEFLEAVSPVVALIGVGKNNTYGHPSDEAIERLTACGAKVFRTDIDGAIGVRCRRRRDGSVQLEVNTARK